jgi:DHA2 family methylenomycin A resistance protein-like MFS transporter
MDLAVPSMTTRVLASVAKELSGTASAALNTVRQAAGAIGEAVFGAIASGGGGAV